MKWRLIALIGLGLLLLACGGVGGGGGQDLDPTCRAYCQKFVDCGFDTWENCGSYCSRQPKSSLHDFSNYTCSQIQAVGNGGGGAANGSGCSSNGVQDCSGHYRCCRNGHFTSQGEAGMCMDPAVCLMPRR